MATGSGDKLARGAAKAQFPPAGGTQTEQEWNDKVGSFDPAQYLKNVEKQEEETRRRLAQKALNDATESERLDHEREERRRNANAEEAGVSSTEPGEVGLHAGI
jgi:hypothetical protein